MVFGPTVSGPIGMTMISAPVSVIRLPASPVMTSVGKPSSTDSRTASIVVMLMPDCDAASTSVRWFDALGGRRRKASGSLAITEAPVPSSSASAPASSAFIDEPVPSSTIRSGVWRRLAKLSRSAPIAAGRLVSVAGCRRM